MVKSRRSQRAVEPSAEKIKRTNKVTDYQDKTLTCRDCGKEFVWTAGEQRFFADKGFANPPSRCPEDRKRNRQERQAQRTPTKITCKECGQEGEVPFTPKDPNDILCSNCFYKMKESQKEPDRSKEDKTDGDKDSSDNS